ncbi:DUF2653 family protein [Paenibacillus contaminans]|jgi:hypothetical protein|uniref:DUF2653 domain-containing protein n=1 Tax=Paenibacillus contaminans TaxID=450362 RepID=A0A329MGP0_9BACL|nr:DUF2653 family protein [Paenibacillus contaminans]RAV18788.1 DUF2653 domain-containing protein [Paenibacillus contaminans]
MRLSEQDIMNAICMHIAERKQLRPEQVSVQLMYDEDLGFSAEVTAEGRSQYLIEASMKEAIERYLLNVYNTRAFRSQIELDIEEEMIAIIHD